MKQLARYSTFSAVTLVTWLVVFAAGVPGARALTLSPVRLELTADPGQSINGTFELYNDEGASKTFYSSFENFEAQGESGTPHFTPGTEGLATWLEAPRQVTLAAAERKMLHFSVAVPKDADPGGHFAAIFWTASPPPAPGSGQVALGAKVGILVLLNVTGSVKEVDGLLGFGTTTGQKFFTALPVNFYYRFHNGGGDRVQPLGQIEVTNMFGGTAVRLDANPGQGNVLPNSVRRFEVAWSASHPAAGGSGFFAAVSREWHNFAFGWYTAHLNLSYGTRGETVSSAYNLFLIPWQLLLVALIVLLSLTVLGRWGIHRYNQWIIRKASATARTS